MKAEEKDRNHGLPELAGPLRLARAGGDISGLPQGAGKSSPPGSMTFLWICLSHSHDEIHGIVSREQVLELRISGYDRIVRSPQDTQQLGWVLNRAVED